VKAKAISIHSSRGGTGKTVIATNLAVILTSKDYNIALLDLDFRAPSLATVFSKQIESPTKCWLNDFLDSRCNAEQVLIDISGRLHLKGKLLVGLANPNIDAIRSVMEKSRAWEVTAVKKLFLMLSLLFSKMGVDCCIFDTSPGVQYSSINSAISSDLSVMVTTMDSLDLEGTKNILSDLYDKLSRKTAVLVNKYSPETRISSNDTQDDLVKNVQRTLKHRVIGVIPCYCDVLQQERASILAVEKPGHPFVKKLEEVAEKIDHIV
jgi:MinD-like ATPase involved in chromosome partitioning or flagellar assembly